MGKGPCQGGEDADLMVGTGKKSPELYSSLSPVEGPVLRLSLFPVTSVLSFF